MIHLIDNIETKMVMSELGSSYYLNSIYNRINLQDTP